MIVCKFWGIRIKINWLFLLVVVLFALVGELARALTAFFIVLLHELGHVVVARFSGLRISQIELLPFGGVAVFDDLLEVDHRLELKVALAGPLVNFFLILLAVILTRYHLLELELALFFIQYNLCIGLFNLFPALPLDGGRIFRAALVPWKGFWQATHWMINFSRCLAFIIGVGALYFWISGSGGLLSLMAAFFVYFAALKESEISIYVLVKYLTKKKRKLLEYGIIYGEEYLVLADTMLVSVLKTINPRAFARFLIYEKNYNFLGILTEIEVIDAFFEKGLNVPISQLLSSK